ncbi:hypothetical protein BaRGS_00026583 [Batillaria attramentaria]|uniref:Uncharacterized protein n=1 Tax=Batillaria attramentaria TaxID=370345 RepID=A0ABD0K4W2_9CAEN
MFTFSSNQVVFGQAAPYWASAGCGVCGPLRVTVIGQRSGQDVTSLIRGTAVHSKLTADLPLHSMLRDRLASSAVSTKGKQQKVGHERGRVMRPCHMKGACAVRTEAGEWWAVIKDGESEACGQLLNESSDHDHPRLLLKECTSSAVSTSTGSAPVERCRHLQGVHQCIYNPAQVEVVWGRASIPRADSKEEIKGGGGHRVTEREGSGGERIMAPDGAVNTGRLHAVQRFAAVSEADRRHFSVSVPSVALETKPHQFVAGGVIRQIIPPLKSTLTKRRQLKPKPPDHVTGMKEREQESLGK